MLKEPFFLSAHSHTFNLSAAACQIWSDAASFEVQKLFVGLNPCGSVMLFWLVS